MSYKVTKIGSLDDYHKIVNKTPLNEEALDAATEYVRQEGPKAWDVIEPLAGMFWGRVKFEVERRLREQP